MPTDAVGFTTDQGPELLKGVDEGFPDDCFIYKWVVSFAITRGGGTSPPTAPVSGFVVQRVDVSKAVFECNGTLDAAASKSETVFETFKVADGDSEGTDTIQFNFPKNRRTSVSATFGASFLPVIRGATRTAINPLTNPGGADGTLDKQPTGFSPTLFRKVHVFVDCCGGSETFFWETRAYNSFGTYEEKWTHRTGQDGPQGSKSVDGKPVEQQSGSDGEDDG